MAILKNLIVNGVTRVIGDLTASKIIKQGGVSSQFLKADGSVDSTSYYHSGNKPSLSDLGAASSDHTHSYLPLSGGTMNGNIEVDSTYTYNLGSNTKEFKNAYLREIHARHLDASAVYSGDHNLYIGFGSGSPTNKTLFYYSTESTRTQFAEINSNGLYALTRFGVNGQNTSYNLYVNGSANITSDLYENGNKVITTANIGSQSVNYATSAGYALSLDSISLPGSTTNAANTVWCKFATITFNEFAYCNVSGYIFFSEGEGFGYKGILEYHFRADQIATALNLAQLSWLVKSHSYMSVIAVKVAGNVYDFYINNCSTWNTPKIYHFSAFNNGFKWNVGSWTTTKPTAAVTSSDVGRVNYATNASTASKWSAARKITLTGSVTGEISVDGSSNVTLATTTNHTHTFASLTSKPTTISGYGITDALTTSNYNSYVPKLDGTGATGTWGIDISGDADTVDGFHANAASNGKYFGKIPVIGTDGVTELGCYIDFHYDTTTSSDYSTRLEVTGNYNNTVILPSITGTLALTSQIPSSLPANGGNADTVDGYHASDLYKLISFSPNDGSKDCDDFRSNALYTFSYDFNSTSNTLDNKPLDSGIDGGCSILTVTHGTYSNQIFFDYGGYNLWFRGEIWAQERIWNPWKRIALSGESQPANGGNADYATSAGSASSASKWTTARKITLIGSVTGEVSIDGSGDVTLSTTTNHTHSYLPLSGGSMSNTNTVTNLNADLLDGNHASAFATAEHTHSYLPLSGGTITGTLTISRDAAAIHYNNQSGVSQGWLGFSAADTPSVWMADGSTRYNIIHSGNISSQSVNYATSAGSSNTATIAGSLGDNDTINMYAQYSNEINFGGGNSASTICFGCRATDSRPIPTDFIFGSSTGTANLKASKFIKTGSSDSYVLLGAGGHKAISDFATSDHTHDYIPLSGSINISGNLRFSREYTFQGYTPRKRGNGGGWNYKPFSIIDYSGSDFAHFGVYGDNNDLKYIYIGSNDYDSNDNLRIYPNGNINAGNFFANSDIRYKNIIEYYYSFSDKIAQLPIIKYKWTDRDDDSIRIGSSAQSVMSIIPELVSYDDNTDFYSLDYATLGAVAGISACKEVEMLKQKIKELEQEIIILKSKYNG